MPEGTVKWFNTTKGYGFIAPEEGGKDVFVHISAVERSGLTGMADNQKVSFELIGSAPGNSINLNALAHIRRSAHWRATHQCRAQLQPLAPTGQATRAARTWRFLATACAFI